MRKEIPAIPVNLLLRDASASTALSAIAKETSLEIRIEPYAIVMEPPGSKFYRDQRVGRARAAARKGLKAKSSKVRPLGEDSALGTTPADPRSPAHPDYVGSTHPDRSKRTNAIGNTYKWVGGKWTFVRYQDGKHPEGGLRTGSLDSPPE